MVENGIKKLVIAFVLILIGVVLIVPIANETAARSVSSNLVSNESLSFASLTSVVSNESQANTGNGTIGATYQLNNFSLTAFTEVRNGTAVIITTQCNATLATGSIDCNATNSTNLFFDYTFISGKSVTLANDEVTINTLKNVSSEDITGSCTVTTRTGFISCGNFQSNQGFANYTYIPDGFVRSASTRTILNLLPLFFSLAILAMGIGFAMSAMRDMELL